MVQLKIPWPAENCEPYKSAI